MTTPRPYDRNRPLHGKRRVALVATAALASLAAWALAHFPRAVETAYTNGIGQYAGRALARISSLVPFSLAETSMAILILWMLSAAAISIYRVIRRRRQLSNALLCGALRLGATAGAIIVIFYTAWGFNYARADLVHRMQWQSFAEKALAKPDADRLAKFCDALVDAANHAYQEAFNCEDLGRPSGPKETMREIDAAIDRAYICVTERLHLHPMFARSRGPAKPLLISPIISYFLITGFYSPWTGEANYDWQIPSCTKPETIAHEKAHQRGITSEDEANFFGFLACASSDDPYVRYSGLLMAQRQLLSELLKRDPARAKALIAKRFKGVQRDADAARAFVVAHMGAMSKVGSTVNNAYLKANRVSAGVNSYQLSARLILIFAEYNGGTPIPH